jgi:hypothetical protein
MDDSVYNRDVIVAGIKGAVATNEYGIIVLEGRDIHLMIQHIGNKDLSVVNLWEFG